MAINYIRLRNFKGFKDAHLQLKPLTVLLGPNSSGKSSFGQAIVALSKNLPRNRGYVPSLDFTEADLFSQPSSIDFGRYLDLVHDGCEGESIIIELGLSKHGKLSFGFGGNSALNSSTKIKELDLTFIEVKYPEIGATVSELPSPSASPTEIDIPQEVSSIIYDGFSTNIMQRYAVKNWNVKTSTSDDEYKLFFDGLKIEGIIKLTGTPVELGQVIPEQLFDDAVNLLSKVAYLRPDRVAPVRVDRKSPESSGAEINDWGSGAGWYLYENCDIKVQTFFFPKPTTNKDEAERDISDYESKKPLELGLTEAIIEWLKRIGVAVTIESKKLGEDAIQVLATPPGQTKARPLLDLGFGMSQIFPVLLKGLTLEQNGLFVVEQPEGQLHPKPQAELADFFCAMIKCGRRVIVETHSVELFHRLRLRAAMDSDLAENIAVYFFHEPEEKGCCSEPVKISLEEEAELKWPKDFLPEGIKTEYEIVQMRLASKKRNK